MAIHGQIKLGFVAIIVFSGGVVEWITRRTGNVKIGNRMGSNPVRGKTLFPLARMFTLIAQYWLVPGTNLKVFQLTAFYTIELK